MSNEEFRRSVKELVQNIENAETDKLSELSLLAGLDLAEDLVGIDVSGEDLSHDNLSGANLSEANLSFTNLVGTNLSNANLRKANLSGADLSYANLEGTDLSGADLDGAVFAENPGINEVIRKDLIRRGAIFKSTSTAESEGEREKEDSPVQRVASKKYLSVSPAYRTFKASPEEINEILRRRNERIAEKKKRFSEEVLSIDDLELVGEFYIVHESSDD